MKRIWPPNGLALARRIIAHPFCTFEASLGNRLQSFLGVNINIVCLAPPVQRAELSDCAGLGRVCDGRPDRRERRLRVKF